MHVPGLQLSPPWSAGCPQQYGSAASLFSAAASPLNGSLSQSQSYNQLQNLGCTHSQHCSQPELSEISRSRDSVHQLDYANSYVWNVTLEYENLLNIQKDQHAVAVRHLEAEAFRLRQAVQMLQTGHCDEGYVQSQLWMKDEEHRLAIETKQKELELCSSLLRVRDRQIQDLQNTCENQMKELRECRAGTAASTNRDQDANAGPLAEVFKQAEQLRKEKAELEQLLISKDKQIGAVQSVSPDMADSSALQLGAQAIQMFHDSMRMKAESADLSQENKDLQSEVESLQNHIENLDATVAEKQGEIKELTSTLTGKMQQVLELESEASTLRREKQQTLRATSVQLDKLQDELSAWQGDCKTAQELVEDLKRELADRDHRFMQQQAECARHEVSSKTLQRQVEEMGVQLSRAEEALSEMMNSNSFKDQLVRDMTDQVNISETKLNSFHMNELLGSRQRLATRSRVQSIGLQPFADADSSFEARLKASPLPLRKSGRFAASPDLGDCDTSAISHAALDVSKVLVTSEDRGAHRSRQTSPASSGGSPTPMSYCSQRQLSSGIQEPLARQAPGRRSAHLSWQASVPERRASDEVTTSVPASGYSAEGSSACASSASKAPMFLAESYRPQPGDPIDLKVSEFTNQPRNSACKALFCRLGAGSYLFGTQKVNLQVNPRTDSLEAFVDSRWLPIEEFVRRTQSSQSVHLQRAQQMAVSDRM